MTAFRAYGDHIEAARVRCPARLLEKEVLCRTDQLLSLSRVYAFDRAAPGGMSSIANFDEYYCIALKHDQIELAAAAQPVLCQQPQALATQMVAG
jgi:hypothetical protein